MLKDALNDDDGGRDNAKRAGLTVGPARGVRRGSILIMVIALLVLIALMGTAYVSVARIDRQRAAVTGTVAQRDLTTDGVAEVARSLVAGSLFDMTKKPPTYRPPNSSQYNSFTAFNAPNGRDAWLASRIPEPQTFGQPVGANNPPVWESVTIPKDVLNATQKYTIDWPTRNIPGGEQPVVLDDTKLQFNFVPGSVGNPAVPSLTVTKPDGTEIHTPVPAADADGDGIADSFYNRLQTQGDVTYYYGIRIIDNNSAINASTAMALMHDLDGDKVADAAGGYTPNLGLFPANIGLEELLRTYDPTNTNAPVSAEIDRLNQFRLNANDKFGLSTGMTGLPDLTGQSPSGTTLINVFNDPRSGNWATNPATNLMRSDVRYLTYGDALFTGLARRIENPAYNGFYSSAETRRFQPLTWADQGSLAARFVLAPQSPSSPVEVALKESLFDAAVPSGTIPSGATNVGTGKSTTGWAVRKTPYAADGVLSWYWDNFAYDQEKYDSKANVTNTFRPRRAMLVARNPVSNAAPATLTTGKGVIPKANINTSQFDELRAAFQRVMDGCTDTGAGDASKLAAKQQNWVFRDVTRVKSSAEAGYPKLNPYQMKVLRGALAAVNAEAIRGQGQVVAGAKPFSTVLSRRVKIAKSETDASEEYDVTVFGMAYQPYITEVVIDEGTSAPYVAIRLYNPSPVAIELRDWHVATYDKLTNTGAVLPPGTQRIKSVFKFDQSTTFADGSKNGNGGQGVAIPANDYIILTSGTQAGSNAIPASPQSPPAATPPATQNPLPLTAPPPGKVVVVPGLYDPTKVPLTDNAAYHEILILRPRDPLSGRQKDTTTGNNEWDETNAIYGFQDMVPVDQFDNSGWTPANPPTGGPIFRRFHYARTSDIPGSSVYAGQYLPDYSPVEGHYKGSQTVSFNAATDTNNQPLLSAYNVVGGTITLGAPTTIPTVSPAFIIPLAESDTILGPNALKANNTSLDNKFPFGGFARNGDMLKVPFIGSYRINNIQGTPDAVEMHSVSHDAMFADDGDPADDGNASDPASEWVGRFVPVGNPVAKTGDYSATESNWRYRWTRGLFDHLTAVSSPHVDYTPNVSKFYYSTAVETPNLANTYPPPRATGDPKTVEANLTPNEDAVPVEGLININTASWKVLSMLPMVLNDDGTINRALNDQLAQEIVKYRRENGIFTSVWDLNFVPKFYTAMDTLGSSSKITKNVGANHRVLSAGTTLPRPAPSDTASDGRVDYLDATVALNRISNLITTRSDSFTVYVVVEGWENAGTPGAKRVSQTRQAYVMDRSKVTGNSQNVSLIPIPNE